MKITIKKNEAEIEGDSSLVSKLIVGCKGKLKINSPLLGNKELKAVKKLPKAKV